MRDGALDYAALSTPRLSKVLPDRPATDLDFLRWLLPRQGVLGRPVAHDNTQCSLRSTAATATRSTLGGQTHHTLHATDAVLLRKGLYPYVRTNAHPRTAESGFPSPI